MQAVSKARVGGGGRVLVLRDSISNPIPSVYCWCGLAQDCPAGCGLVCKAQSRTFAWLTGWGS